MLIDGKSGVVLVGGGVEEGGTEGSSGAANNARCLLRRRVGEVVIGAEGEDKCCSLCSHRSVWSCIFPLEVTSGCAEKMSEVLFSIACCGVVGVGENTYVLICAFLFV